MVKADAYSIQDPYLQQCRVASRCGLVNGSQGWPHITVCHPEPQNLWSYYLMWEVRRITFHTMETLFI